MQNGVAVSNGTAGLQLAVACLDLQPGDEVILPSFTIISCVTAVLYNGGKPVLVDADPETWCLDVSQLEGRMSSRTRAIMPVHIYGHPVDMDPVLELAKTHGLLVIEDAAEAHGAEYLSGREGQGGHRLRPDRADRQHHRAQAGHRRGLQPAASRNPRAAIAGREVLGQIHLLD